MPRILELAPGVRLELDENAYEWVVRQLGTAPDPQPSGAQPGPQRTLGDDHPYWERHTGGAGHSKPPEWAADDLTLAEAFYAGLTPKAKIFIDILIDHPGQLLSTDDIQALAPDTFANHFGIAGSINGLLRLRLDARRRYPFYWWKGTPTTYAMKPFVAELFRKARGKIRS